MSFCSNCFQGVTHDGTPEGKIDKLGGVECYIATPTVDYPKDKVVLFLTDVFGLALKNNLLMADDFARNGFKTIVPDLFNGDPRAPLFGPDAPPVDREKWRAAHGPAQTRPPIDSVITALNTEGVTSIAATGYCFGARYVVDLAFDGLISVAALSHPSMLVVPADLEKYAAVSTAPLLLNTCPVDPVFPLEAQAQADAILGGGKFTPWYKREHFEGCQHGFAVRGDMSDPMVKAGKEGAFKASVEWFMKHL
ncbi:dienelactone hydrolase endo-1,3,1,4-beta-D-glucanase [Mycena belliarum]|uniref:Dienelactone hydrolase endo-1,3,1,4-beta-D-glucanase n=1 Tax=Mycena belliarum TaxID=1033014 RepID=A0AAD6UDJ4_9AGAR|nr:dienelactone hydrolase endo-1,3,1,4-beta-D-glucanase [Mycena belliae]